MNKLPIEKLLKEHVLTIRCKEYQLRKVSKEELLLIRLKNEPGVVFTCNSEIWYAKLPSEKIKLSGEKWLEHCCSWEKDTCRHLSALPDSQGGCGAIRDTSVQDCLNYCRNPKQAVINSFRIEKYDFLEYALETFGMEENSFKALKCKNMEYIIHRAIYFDAELQKQRIVEQT